MSLMPVDAFMNHWRGKGSRWAIEHDAFDEEMRELEERLNRPVRNPKRLKPRKPVAH